jgi:ATP-dependent RNA helicase RhlE
MTHTDTGRFADLGIGENFLEVLTKKGFMTPTPIQHQVIPGALEGNDVIGIAQTGTGKTLAFGIPMIQRLALQKTQGLIIVPTRELAEQVESEMFNLGGELGLRTAVLIGGAGEDRQIRALKKNPHLVIATPGRLMDFVERNIFKLSNVSIVTLDEADRMLDMGFLPSIKKVMKQVPDNRQTMLFSATMPSSIAALASEFMRTPMRIEIAPQGTSAVNIEQELYIVRSGDKIRLLDAILEEYKEDTVLVFSRTKHGAKRMVRDIRAMGHAVTEMHGNKSQAQRRAALDGLVKKKYRVMVATDVAARGIDVDHITLVINYDLPDSLEDYVHRIGRTGRAGRFGKAIAFATPDQRSDVRGIERIIKKSLKVLDIPTLPAKREPLPEESGYSDRGERRGSGGRGNSDRMKRKRTYQRRSEGGRNSGGSAERSSSQGSSSRGRSANHFKSRQRTPQS